MGVTNYEAEVVNWVQFSIALVSLSCSALTLYLIYYMRIRNGYFMLITSMTICQLIYDFNFTLAVVKGYTNCVVWHVFDYLGGLSFSFWSNVISFVVLYIVVKIRSLNIYNNYWAFFTVAMGPPLVIAVLTVPTLVTTADDDEPDNYCKYKDNDLATFVENAYYWGRILSILFNFFVFLFISHRVRLMMRAIGRTDSKQVIVQNPLSGSDATSNPTVSSGYGLSSGVGISQSAAISALVSRMKYYPLAQVVARFGSSWNEFDSYKYSNYPSSLLAAVCGPSAGTLNFIIFLIMQPKAWRTLLSFFGMITVEKRSDSLISRTSSFAITHELSSNNTPDNTWAFDYDEDALENLINNEDLSGQRSISSRTNISWASNLHDQDKLAQNLL